MQGIFQRPVAVHSKVGERDVLWAMQESKGVTVKEPPVDGLAGGSPAMMYVALAYDHRLVHGGEAVPLLHKIKAVVEDSRAFLLDMYVWPNAHI